MSALDSRFAVLASHSSARRSAPCAFIRPPRRRSRARSSPCTSEPRAPTRELACPKPCGQCEPRSTVRQRPPDATSFRAACRSSRPLKTAAASRPARAVRRGEPRWQLDEFLRGPLSRRQYERSFEVRDSTSRAGRARDSARERRRPWWWGRSTRSAGSSVPTRSRVGRTTAPRCPSRSHGRTNTRGRGDGDVPRGIRVEQTSGMFTLDAGGSSELSRSMFACSTLAVLSGAAAPAVSRCRVAEPLAIALTVTSASSGAAVPPRA